MKPTYQEAKQSAVDWLSKSRYKGVFSELGKNSALFLDHIFGLHHINGTSLKKVDWSNDTWIEIILYGPLSTVDSDQLTRMVVIAHHMMLRLELSGTGPNYQRLVIHQRLSRDASKGTWQWCPTIEDHTDRILSYFPTDNSMTE